MLIVDAELNLNKSLPERLQHSNKTHIIVASPNQRLWKRAFEARVLYMPLWSVEELRAVATHVYPEHDLDVEGVAGVWGGVPRRVFSYRTRRGGA